MCVAAFAKVRVRAVVYFTSKGLLRSREQKPVGLGTVSKKRILGAGNFSQEKEPHLGVGGLKPDKKKLRMEELLACCDPCGHGCRPESRFVFTLNNPNVSEDGSSLRAAGRGPAVDYLVFQLEAGEVHETPHFQGYVEFERDVPVCQARELLEAPRLWMKAAIQNRKANRIYCTKVRTRVKGPWLFLEGESQRRMTKRVRAAAGRASGAVRKKSAVRERKEARRASGPSRKAFKDWYGAQPESQRKEWERTRKARKHKKYGGEGYARFPKDAT